MMPGIYDVHITRQGECWRVWLKDSEGNTIHHKGDCRDVASMFQWITARLGEPDAEA